MTANGKTWVEGRHARSAVLVSVQASPEQAFDYVSDFTRHHEWALDEIHVEPVTPGPVKLGSRYASMGRQGGREWPSELEVTVYEPPRRFEFTATGGPIPTPPDDLHRHEFVFTPEGGGTRMELHRTDPAPPGWPNWFVSLVLPLILRATLSKRVQTVERLQARLNELAGRETSLHSPSTSDSMVSPTVE